MLKIKPRPPKRLNNVEFVTEMMEFSQFGALTQAFIIEAIDRYSKQVAASTPDQYPPNDFFSPEVWIGIGKEIQQKLSARNKQ